MDKKEPKQKPNLLADALYIIEKYKCKFAAGQFWFNDKNKWTSASIQPLSVIITREFCDKYKDSFKQIDQIEKFIKNIVQDKHSIDIKKSFSVYFLNGVVKYNKNCFKDPQNLLTHENSCFHKYTSDEEKHSFTPSIINDEFIGTVGSQEFENTMSTEQGKEVVRIVNKYYDFLSIDQNKQIRKDVRDYLLALGWLGHSTATLEQITYLLGDGANGKSWWTNKVLYNLVGKNNFGAFKLDKINESFGYQPFLNKSLMVDPDAKNSLIEDDKFKSLCGTDIVNINIKNKDAISTELFSTVILCTNHNPKYVDYSSSMSRRMVLIKLYSCVYENINSGLKTKTKMALTEAEQEIFFSKLSYQYQRSIMFDAFCRLYDVENKLLITPKDSSDLNQELERENNEIYAWCEEEQWIQKALDNSERGELFVYPQYVFDKYRDYYKENNDGSDKGFTLKRNGVWQRFKELMESKYRNKYQFNTNEKVRQRIGGSQPSGFIIKSKEIKPGVFTDEELDTIINQNNEAIREYLTKIENLKNQNNKIKQTKVNNEPVESIPQQTQESTVQAITGDPNNFRLSKDEMDKPITDNENNRKEEK